MRFFDEQLGAATLDNLAVIGAIGFACSLHTIW